MHRARQQQIREVRVGDEQDECRPRLPSAERMPVGIVAALVFQPPDMTLMPGVRGGVLARQSPAMVVSSAAPARNRRRRADGRERRGCARRGVGSRRPARATSGCQTSVEKWIPEAAGHHADHRRGHVVHADGATDHRGIAAELRPATRRSRESRRQARRADRPPEESRGRRSVLVRSTPNVLALT